MTCGDGYEATKDSFSTDSSVVTVRVGTLRFRGILSHLSAVGASQLLHARQTVLLSHTPIFKWQSWGLSAGG